MVGTNVKDKCLCKNSTVLRDYLKMPYEYFQLFSRDIDPFSHPWCPEALGLMVWSRDSVCKVSNDVCLNIQTVSSFQRKDMKGNQPPYYWLSVLDPQLSVLFTRCSLCAPNTFTISSVIAELTILHCYTSIKLCSKFCRVGSNISTFIYKCHINGF